MFWAGGLIGQLWGVGSGVWCVGLQHSRQNWPDRGWCWAGKNTRDELAQQGHGHIMPSQTSVVPAGNHTIFLQQLAWGANQWCLGPLMCLSVCFRGRKGGPVNPASFKYSSPSKVSAPAEPVGQEEAGGRGDAGVGGTHSWDVPPQLGFCCLLLSPRWTKQRPYLSGSAVQAGASFPHALSFGCGPGL